VEAAKQLLADRYRELVGLDQLTRTLGTSAAHLCRCFKQQTGVTIHRYLTRLRLREALNRIDACRGELTDLALDLGFSSHSHFTAAFRREFGLPPGRLSSTRVTPAQLRQLARQVREAESQVPR